MFSQHNTVGGGRVLRLHESWTYTCILHGTATMSYQLKALHALTCYNPQEHCKCRSSIWSRSSVHIVSWARIIRKVKRCSILHFILCKVLCCNNVLQPPAEGWFCCTNTADVIQKSGCRHAIVKVIKSILHNTSQGWNKHWSWTNSVSFFNIPWAIAFLHEFPTVLRYACCIVIEISVVLKFYATTFLWSWNKRLDIWITSQMYTSITWWNQDSNVACICCMSYVFMVLVNVVSNRRGILLVYNYKDRNFCFSWSLCAAWPCMDLLVHLTVVCQATADASEPQVKKPIFFAGEELSPS